MKTKRKFTPFTLGKIVFSMIALMSLVIGCGGDPPVATSTTGTLNIGVAVYDGAAGSQITGEDEPALAAQVSSLQITSARIVLSSIKIHSAVGDILDFSVSSPVVIDLNLNGSVQDLASITVPIGYYNRTEFKIDAVESTDTVAWNADPEMRSISIRIEGYVEGDAASTFIWTSNLDEEQVFEPTNSFYVGGGATSLVIMLDHSAWFTDPVGGILDPRVAENHSQIENNFKGAFDVDEAAPLQ